MRSILFITTCLLFFQAEKLKAQSGFADSIKDHVVPFSMPGLSNTLLSVSGFPDKKCYLFGELHGTQASLTLEWEMIRILYQQKGITNLLIEMPHSEVFFFQKYIETGDSSLLHEYDGRINKSFLDSIRTLNTLDGPAIHLWGIDLDISFRSYFYSDCLQYLLRTHSISDSNITTLLQHIIENRNNKNSLFELDKALLKEFETRPAIRELAFGKDLIHLQLILYSQKKEEGRRDDELFLNFVNLHSLLGKSGYSLSGYLGFFGGSHVYSTNQQSLAHLIVNHPNSPVYKNVSISGIQYVNCLSSQFSVHPSRFIEIYNDGIIAGSNSSFKVNRSNEFLETIEEICTQQPKQQFLISSGTSRIFSNWKKKQPALAEADFLFILQGFGPTHE